jgi:hypothetical protein
VVPPSPLTPGGTRPALLHLRIRSPLPGTPDERLAAREHEHEPGRSARGLGLGGGGPRLLLPVAATRENPPARRPQGVRCAVRAPCPDDPARAGRARDGEEEGPGGTALQTSRS